MRRKIRRNMRRKLLHGALATALMFTAVPFSAVNAEAAGPTIKLRMLETTDIHTHIMDYDYYKDASVETFGLVRTASLIKELRAEAKNSVLVDNGDLIQGNPLGEYVAKVKGLQEGDVHPVFKAMNMLDYDAATPGNHEFNFGLEFLDEAIDDANFPYVNANVYDTNGTADTNDDTNYFQPYIIVEKMLVDEQGNEHTLKIGYTGFTPPQINTWDKTHLDGKVVTKDIVESAKATIPQMKAAGADLVFVMAHSGIDTAAQEAGAENAVYDLAMQVPDIDVIVSGHQHDLFPGATRFNNVPGIDPVKGTINGIPVVMPKNWGSHLGVIDMDLQQVNGKWEVVNSESKAAPIYNKQALVEPDADIAAAIADDHEATLDYVRQAVGTTTAPINSFFALVQDDPSVQIVNDAQTEYAKEKLAGTEYESLPILSAAAPFKAGGRNGADYYTNIAAGPLAIKNIGDLYLYDNTVQIVKLNGAQVKEWLERSAGAFNQIDPNVTSEQPLLNPSFPSYNYDVIDGVTYEIDVTQPSKYSADGKQVINPYASRIKQLKFKGEPIDPKQQFIVVTNNYRASGGGYFPNLNGGDNIILKSPDENRQALMDYIVENKEVNPAADNNWSIAPIAGDVNVMFESSAAAKDFAVQSKYVTYVEEAQNGFAKYAMNLEKEESDTFNLTVMHTNDTHAHLDNIARRITAIQDVRAYTDNSILLDAGDVFSGTLFFNQYLGQADLEFMNAIGYDAMVPGNHEFDKGPKVFADFVKNATFPIVSSNINYSSEPELSGLFRNEIARPGTGGNIYPAAVIDVNGEKVGVFGLTTEETSILANPGEHIIFENYLEKAEQTVDMLEAKGINKIVALTHLGFSFDQVLAQTVDGIDIVVGGHTHTKLEEPVVYDVDSEPTIVVQAQEYSMFLGKLDVAFNKQGVLQAWDETLIDLDAKAANGTYIIADHPTAAARLTELKAPIEELKSQIVGSSSVVLDGNRSSIRTKETNLGNLITDSMLAKAQESTNATIAIQNGGGIRASIDAGDISLGEVLTTMPFGNTLVTLDLTGAEIVAALENGVSQVEFGAGRFPQVAGLKFSFDRTQPAGKRVVDVFVKTAGGYEPINLENVYTVATNAYAADGGDGYSMFRKAKDEGRMTELFYVDYDVFTDYLAKHNPVASKIEGRITEVVTASPKLSGKGSRAAAKITDSAVNSVANNQTLALQLATTSKHRLITVDFTASAINKLAEKGAHLSVGNSDMRLTLSSEVMSQIAASSRGRSVKLLMNMDRNARGAAATAYQYAIIAGGTPIYTLAGDASVTFFNNAGTAGVYNGKTRKWEALEGSVFNANTNSVSAPITALGKFALISK